MWQAEGAVKTVVIGLDAATWSVLDPLIDDGALPNIGELVDEGAVGVLESTTPPMTPQAWTSMATGVNPGKHGIFDFLSQERSNYRIGPVDFSQMAVPAIWDVFEMNGADVGFLNFPLANPPPEVEPFFVSGIPAPDEHKIAYPPAVQEILDSMGYRVHPHVDPEIDPDQFYREVLSLTKGQGDATIELLNQYDLDLLWVVFMGTDWVQHFHWDKSVDGQDALERFHRQIDEIVGRIRDEIDETVNVVLVSDHGARPIEGVIHMNSLLEELGYLKRSTVKVNAVDRLRNRILSFLWRAGTRLPPTAKRRMKQLGSQVGLMEEMKRVAGRGQRDLHERIEWAETRAFSYGYMGRVFIHTVDEYPKGTVDGESYDELRRAIIDDLNQLTHPETGQELFDAVLRGEGVYEGDRADHGPDLLAVPADWVYTVYGDFGEEWIHGPRGRVADHDPEGVLVAAGEPFDDTSIEAAITDIAPSLLYLHDLPLVDGMEGSVLSEAFTEQFQSGREVRTISEVPFDRTGHEPSSQLDEAVESRLENLGYR